MGVIVVAGVPAVGKTTVLVKLAKKTKFKVINVGDEMLALAVERGLLKHRDDLRKQHPSVQEELWRDVVEKIADRAEGTPIIVETYCSVKTPKGYMPGLPQWALKALRPSTIILLEADPDEILVRRVKDTSRLRDLEYVAHIEEHQRMDRVFAMAYATFTGATVKMIMNHDSSVEKAVAELAKTLEGIHV
ncbi:MAG: adenylate kinase [Candidatus Hydrothermarchaeota archaeon]